jgi:hypothetical protein
VKTRDPAIDHRARAEALPGKRPFMRTTTIAFLLLTGCQGGTSGSGLNIYFPTMYSAYDGVHKFQIPATVGGVAGVRWSASDPSLVDVDPEGNGSTVMLTMRGSGSVTLRAEAGNLAGVANLTILPVSPDLWEIGNKRYNNGIVPPRRGDGGMGSDGGSMLRMMQACANCHNGQQDVEHTPTQTGGFSDSELINIITRGMKPPGIEQRILAADRFMRIHQWVMTDDEQEGLVVYLRALTPKSQGPYLDWGGRTGGGGGGMGKPRDMGASQ